MTLASEHVLWVRHGQSTWNVIDRFQGQIAHPPLTARGRDQARRAADALADRGIEHLVSSPLRRAAQTARIIADHLGLPLTFDDRLVEQEYDETPREVRARARAFSSDLSPALTAVVTHGNFIQHAARELTGMEIEVPDNGEVLQLEVLDPAATR